MNWQAGKVIEEDHYYDLLAHDVSGEAWRAKRLLPDRSSGPCGSMITARFQELELDQSEAGHPNIKGTSVNFYFDEIIKVPLNTVVREESIVNEKTRSLSSGLKLARFSSLDLSFEVDNSSGKTIFRAASEDPQVTNVQINRIFESFCFVLAYTRSWSALVVSRPAGTVCRLRAVGPEHIKTRAFPPLHISHDSVTQTVWSLFDKYFAYVNQNLDAPYHPLSVLLRTVAESGKASLDVQALTLSVSVEKLLMEEMKGLYDVSEDLVRNIRCASQLITESGALDAPFRKRTLGALGAMKNPRAKDVLAKLRQRGVIDGELIKTYGELRNKMAHGAHDPDADIQDFFNQTNTVLVLFYQLVFLLMGYVGSYTDYGEYGYPTKEFSGKLA
ncbi:hypothetical protein [Methylocaldum sp.]|uniref:hypothetical protein n=1 Tax=Methylocaldum sp. TaxID=1969727 RepID=UPI00321F7E44